MRSNFTILFILLFPVAAWAGKGDQEHRVKVVKEFAANGGSTLAVHNKYGKILVNVWDKASIRAEIEIVGFGKNDEQARSIAEAVKIESSDANARDVRLETKYSAASRWFGRKDSRDYVNINYVLYIPRSVKAVTLNNQFGDILARELPFKTQLDVNYGFFDVGAAGHLKVNMNYTDKARIGKADRLELNANYSSLKLGRVKELQVNSNNSEYKLEGADVMRINSNYDDCSLGDISTLSLSANYSEVDAGSLQTSLRGNLAYTDLKVRAVAANFQNITLQAAYSDVKVGIRSNAAFQVNVRVAQGDFKASGFDWKDKKETRQNSNLSFSAITNNSTDAAGIVKIDGSYSDIKLSGE
ncbi:DUF4097 family beta strand repeat-containing protein [Chitinophaga lutea]